MPACPQCRKPLRELVRRCPTCQADLDLLVDYVSHLQGGLERAEHLTRSGELGQAVWAYLEVLEVDPDNGTAKRQVGQVAAAVRRFDHTIPSRRWAVRSPGQPAEAAASGWKRPLLIVLFVAATFALGFLAGAWFAAPEESGERPPVLKPRNDTLGG